MRISFRSSVVMVEMAELITPTGLTACPLICREGMVLIDWTVLVTAAVVWVVLLKGMTAAVDTFAADWLPDPEPEAIAVVVVAIVVVVIMVVVEGWVDGKGGWLAVTGARAPGKIGCPWVWGAQRAEETGLVTG